MEVRNNQETKNGEAISMYDLSTEEPVMRALNLIPSAQTEEVCIVVRSYTLVVGVLSPDSPQSSTKSLSHFGVETKAQGHRTPKKQSIYSYIKELLCRGTLKQRRVETAFQSFQRSVLHQMETKREQANW